MQIRLSRCLLASVLAPSVPHIRHAAGDAKSVRHTPTFVEKMQPKAEHAGRIDNMMPTTNKQSKEWSRAVGSGSRLIDTMDMITS